MTPDLAAPAPLPEIDAGATEAAAPEAAPEMGHEGPPASAPLSEVHAGNCRPGAEVWPERIAAGAWHLIEAGSVDGMAGFARAVAEARLLVDRPVKIRLAPGLYQAADSGGLLELAGLQRTASAPLFIEASNPTPDATRLAQGLRLVGASYVAIDGVTIGPPAVGRFHGGDFCPPGGCYHEEPKPLVAEAGIEILGTAIDPARPGIRDGKLDFAVYGRFAPAHHIVLRRITVQNLFGDDEPSGRVAAEALADGIRLRHAAAVWVIDSRIRQTSRGGIDGLAVHGGCFVGNVIAEIGGGPALSAAGGSLDLTFDGNTWVDVESVRLGGTTSRSTDHWSAEPPGSSLHYGYEGRRIVVRNNVLLDPRQGGFVFLGCQDCAAVNNTVLFRVGFDVGQGGGDSVRELDSRFAHDGVDSACLAADGETVLTVDDCWGAGAYPPELVAMVGPDGMSRALPNARNTLANNVFLSPAGIWSLDRPPYLHPEPAHERGFTLADYNLWWNGPSPLMDPGDDTWLAEGPHSSFAAADANLALPNIGVSFDAAQIDVRAVLRAGLRPGRHGLLSASGFSRVPGFAPHDGASEVRPDPPSLGAFEP